MLAKATRSLVKIRRKLVELAVFWIFQSILMFVANVLWWIFTYIYEIRVLISLMASHPDSQARVSKFIQEFVINNPYIEDRVDNRKEQMKKKLV